MLNYVVHSQYFRVQLNVCVISCLFKLILNIIILCICFFSILVLYASLLHMIARLFLKYRFSLASLACSYFKVIPSDPSVSIIAYCNCRTKLLLSGDASDVCLLAKNAWCILQGPLYMCKCFTCSGMLNLNTFFSVACSSGLLRFAREAVYKSHFLDCRNWLCGGWRWYMYCFELMSIRWLVMICCYSYWCVWWWNAVTYTDVSGDDMLLLILMCLVTGADTLPLALLLFQISSVACLACLCSSGTVKVGLFMLPLIGRLRLMMFVTVFSLLVTCLFIFLDISHIVYFFPFNWGKLVSGTVLFCWLMSLLLKLLVLCNIAHNLDSVKGLAMNWTSGVY